MSQVTTRSTSQIKSFVLRQGRLTRGQETALNTLWPKYGIDIQDTLLINPQDLFPGAKKLILEIGFGNGASLLQQAQQFPEHGFIGIEVHPPGIGQLLNNIHLHNLNNLKIIQFDAVQVCNNHLQLNSFNKIQIFFPDPWPKKKHHKRRIIQEEFINIISKLLITKGVLHIATDWEDYATHIKMMTNNQILLTPILTKLKPELHNQILYSRPMTKFEKRGIALQHHVTDLFFSKITI